MEAVASDSQGSAARAAARRARWCSSVGRQSVLNLPISLSSASASFGRSSPKPSVSSSDLSVHIFSSVARGAKSSSASRACCLLWGSGRVPASRSSSTREANTTNTARASGERASSRRRTRSALPAEEEEARPAERRTPSRVDTLQMLRSSATAFTSPHSGAASSSVKSPESTQPYSKPAMMAATSTRRWASSSARPAACAIAPASPKWRLPWAWFRSHR
mmetsp:Transcript_30493/g.71132  ORF Transcript_30493/g.71132 Transcript_30493/m.71132 type:complete len:220 (-) Transcript_30493:531-1190(-)